MEETYRMLVLEELGFDDGEEMEVGGQMIAITPEIPSDQGIAGKALFQVLCTTESDDVVVRGMKDIDRRMRSPGRVDDA